MIDVRFNEINCRSGGYQFVLPQSFNQKWTVLPRPGDIVLDLNEFKFEVIRIMWYDPELVAIDVRRII